MVPALLRAFPDGVVVLLSRTRTVTDRARPRPGLSSLPTPMVSFALLLSFLIAGGRRISRIRLSGDYRRPQPVRRPRKLPKVMHGIHKTAADGDVRDGRRVPAVYHNHRWNEGEGEGEEERGREGKANQQQKVKN